MSSTPGIFPLGHEYLYPYKNLLLDCWSILVNQLYTRPTVEGDGIHIEGSDYPKPVLVRNCTVDFSECKDDTDELVSVVHGGIVAFEDCVFKNGRKACLIGTGDPGEQKSLAFFSNCTFENFGRRGPEVQSNSICFMENCTIKNWGDPDYFDTRNFGAWAHDNGQLIMDNCTFIQSFRVEQAKNIVADIGNHIGNVFNEGYFRNNNNILYGIWNIFKHPMQAFLPGIMRGAMGDTNSNITLYNCKAKGLVYLQHKISSPQKDFTKPYNRFLD